jgi:hypothetical protein
MWVLTSIKRILSFVAEAGTAVRGCVAGAVVAAGAGAGAGAAAPPPRRASRFFKYDSKSDIFEELYTVSV